MRTALALLSAALAGFAAHDWHALPAGARGLVLLLAPAMALLAISAPAWRRRPWFVAGPCGIAFPDDSQLIVTVGAHRAGEWLLVPWSNVSAVRVSRLGGAQARACVAMRVRVAEADRARCFARIPAAVDAVEDPRWLELAWGEALPDPDEVVAALAALRRQPPEADPPAAADDDPRAASPRGATGTDRTSPAERSRA